MLFGTDLIYHMKKGLPSDILRILCKFPENEPFLSKFKHVLLRNDTKKGNHLKLKLYKVKQ